MFRHFQSQEHLACKHSTCRNRQSSFVFSESPTISQAALDEHRHLVVRSEGHIQPKVCTVSSPPQSFGAHLTSPLSLFSLLSTIHKSMKSTSHSLFHLQNFSNILTFFFFLKPAQLSHNRKNLWKCVPLKKTMVSICNNNAVLSSEKE